MNLTVCYITSRRNPEFHWFADTLLAQMEAGECIDTIFVDLYCEKESCRSIEREGRTMHVLHTPPKPTVWQGKHRLTREDWWAASNARNTGICLCQTNTIAFCDDRCFLAPTWLEAVKYSMTGLHIVFGSYEKRIDMVNGDINSGMVIGEDHRDRDGRIVKCRGEWMFGCTFAMPLEWALQVNGFEELCDSLSSEDSIFGKMLENYELPMRFNPRMKIIEDRTAAKCGRTPRRTDKGISPNDKSHAAIERFGKLKRAEHPWNLREIRERVLAGGSWPSVDEFPKTDWYDGRSISEF